MTASELFSLFCVAFGFALGLWLGWLLWRRPSLKYRKPENDV